MTVLDLEAMNRTRPLINALPGEPAPYYLAGGEGLRYEIDGQLWTVIARSVDTGGLFDAAFILGPRGAGAPFHSLADHQRTYHVFDGSVQFWLPGRSRVLVQGDSIHVPPGVPVAYRILGHGSRMLFFSAPGGALDVVLDHEAMAHARVEAHMYSTGAQFSETMLLPCGAARHSSELVDASDEWDDTLPAGTQPYFLRSMTGERRVWPNAINSFTARGRNTGGRYFSVLTTAAAQPYIGRHFHEHHTENFFCMSGRVWLYANGDELLLTPGDFLHAPAGTIHAFAIERHDTRMLGVLTSDVFEPFFDATADATDDLVYTEGLIDPSTFMARLAAHAADLDVVQVGPPPLRNRALDL
ncbi:cupin domain-containing protein [soil metagenome]